MIKRLTLIGIIVSVLCCFAACKNDVADTGQSVLDAEDRIIVLADTFVFHSGIDSCNAIISQADSFLLGEIETDYGLLRASILTQFACPEGYHYPAGFAVDFEAFGHLVEPDLAADSSWFGYKPEMGPLAELGPGLDFLVRSFYGALRL